jgi:DNA modification methylase
VEWLDKQKEPKTMQQSIPYLNEIVTGDARELVELIPDESVDLIFTDPVYERIEDYAWLAEVATRTLKPGGSLLCFQWIAFLRETLNALSPLKLEWILSLYIPNRTKDTRCKVGFNKWTPCLWLSRGDAKSPRTADLKACNAFAPVYGDGSSNHEWSKSPEFVAHYIEAFTKPGAIVYDPFCGGGTMPAMCKMLGRQFIASEIDPERAANAKQRVSSTEPMHEVFLAESQLSFV